ncbi:TIR domain protein [Francisella philomiragia]|uniref:TIR domain-containing protein n=1 Tax=Francisella philomiragia TaxID=28110 RepID=UPI0005A575CB|nr:TIR domain-containing protein [Francisella philomiragia]AJI55157.1 TIR domain protein [Francisella philomiragia]MBK2252739.1 toll/interleukin-1 receptor domain-containing protein [Francisella philomiragia]
MKIFISWSKDLSKECAEILKDWIKCTLQASEPWVSSKDIDKGSLWFNEINDQLKDTKVGIVCLTKENKENPWILFESGALAKGLSANRVCTLLIDLNPVDIKDPMAQFNHTTPNEAGMRDLLGTINKELGNNRLEDRILDQVFEAYWPKFKKDFEEVLSKKNITKENATERTEHDILEEILYTTRTMDRRISLLERRENSFNVNRDFSKVDIVERISMLIKKGLNPKEIVMELDGIAPQNFILDIATQMSKDKNRKTLTEAKKDYFFSNKK